jgi:hypothetical protein
VIAIATLIAIVLVLAFSWFQMVEAKRAAFERTRTHSGPLKIQYSDMQNLLASLPSFKALSPQGLRFVAMPFSHRWYAFALTTQSPSSLATGELVIFQFADDPNESITRRTIRFTAPRVQALRLLTKFERITRSFPGDVEQCTDGTSVAFEFVSGGQISSGSGNAACSAHYRQVSALIADAVGNLLPPPERPGREWMSKGRLRRF